MKTNPGGQVVHERRLAIDMLGRTSGVENRVPGSGLGSPLVTVSSFGHAYDPAGRRKDAKREDGTVWEYGYNNRSEVEAAVKKTSTGTTVPGLGFTYSYDGIGNRTAATVGSNSHVATFGYTPNALNQYEEQTDSGEIWALVRSNAPVFGLSQDIAQVEGITQVGSFHGARVVVDNSAGGQVIANFFTYNGNPVSGSVVTWVPSQETSPIYDGEGNLTNDGRWIYTWDGENRLVSMMPTPSAISGNAPNVEVHFYYDFMGRRLGKSVIGNGVHSFLSKNTSFAYDWWNPVAEWTRVGTNLTLHHTHLWGLDLGSSGEARFGSAANFQKAGGVAGLVASTYHNSSTSKEFSLPCYDANGNIIAWASGIGALIKKSDYDAFGNEVVAEVFTDTTKLPAFGFSTKIKDVETGLSYYGYRYYNPKTGRWPSRDPIGEQGGRIYILSAGMTQLINWIILGLLSYRTYGRRLTAH